MMPFVIYRDLFGAWRWERRETDGTVSESPYSYVTRAECVADATKAGMPASELTATEAEAQAEARTAALPRRSVLCVSSNADAQQFLKKALAEYRLVVAPTGFEALRCLNYAVFDLYILDYWLPDWSGVSLCRDIRKLDPRGPVCFYTTVEGDTHCQRAMRAGASLYINPPIGASSLSQQLTKLGDAADAESLRARLEGERAIQRELERRAAAANAEQTRIAMDRAVGAIERTAKVKTYQAFVDAGGTRAHFERWWPQLFASAWADRQSTRSSEPAR
jgi:DNA-binding response OmpR family regulator